jgi:hypothetical protein
MGESEEMKEGEEAKVKKERRDNAERGGRKDV